MRAATLAKLTRLRERERDVAHQALALAIAEERRFDEKRRGWRQRVAAEQAAAAMDLRAYALWVDACRAHERGTAAAAAALKERVAQTEQDYRHADRAVEQLASLAAEERCRQRRAAEAKTQRALDDMRRAPGDATSLRLE